MPWPGKKKVLVPVDFSEASLSAVPLGLELVDEPSNLCVLHVAREVVRGDPGFPWDPLGEATQRGQLEKVLRDDLAEALESGVQAEIAFGDPGTEIAKFAADGGFDLIVMPSHGRTGLSRILIGSVAERVTRLAHCPVLILRD